MEKQKCKEVGYYRIRKSYFGIGIVITLSIIGGLLFKIVDSINTKDITEIRRNTCAAEYGQMDSKLKSKEECYLCGYSEYSLMGYYRKFDTIGVIGLNEWYVLDLRLKKYDENGYEVKDVDTANMMSGTTQGVHYYVNATPSRGISSAIITVSDVP